MAKQRTQTMAELEQGLFTEIKQPDPKPQPKPESPKPQPPEPETPKPEPNPEPKPKKPLPKWLIPAVAAVAVLAAGIGVGIKMIKSANDYKAAQALMDVGEYIKAAEGFESLGDYEDSAQKAKDARQLNANQKAYEEAQALMNAGKYFQAFRIFSELDYKDSAQLAQEAKNAYWATPHLPLAAGYSHTVALHSNGTLAATGANGFGQCDVSGWTDIRTP